MTTPEPRVARPASPYHQPRSVAELTARNVGAIVEIEAAEKAGQTLSERFASRIARFCGTMTFVWLHVAWFGLWIALNTIPGMTPFDKFPFTFLTLVVSLEAIFLSTFILISQNAEDRVAERRNALDLQINLLTEQENTKMLTMLAAIGEKLGVEFDSDPSLAALEEATRPDKLSEQIENQHKDGGA